LAIGVVQGGLAIQGLNADALAWDEFKPNPAGERVLLVNDPPGLKGHVLSVLESDNVPYCADLSGFRMRLTAPNALNIRTWDIRDPSVIAEGLQALGIDRIVLRSLIGTTDAAPPVEALRAFAAISTQVGISVEVDPVEPMTMTPWRHANEWPLVRKTFGAVDLNAWKAAWQALVPANAATEEVEQ
jgi:hypothetical protein